MSGGAIGPGVTRETFSEFSPDVACDPNSGCWLWSRSITAGGYGRFSIGGRAAPEVYAHRASYEVHVGPLGPGQVVCHRCDTPTCCNPSHLFAGTQGDNVRDAYAKGRLRTPTERGYEPSRTPRPVKKSRETA